MAEKKSTFVTSLVKDPANPPEVLMLSGYLGDSSEADHSRLYLDPELNSYVEIPNDVILHKEDPRPT